MSLITSPAILLDANLQAMRAHSPEASLRVADASPLENFRPITGEDGFVTGELLMPAGAQALSSRRRPGDEAKKIAQNVNLNKAAIFIVLGFGAGHHVRELARRVAGTGLVVVFEPDLSVLRSVLEHVDHSAWLSSGNVRLLTDPEDRAAMVEALRGFEGLVGMGVQLVEHAPSSGRIAAAGKTFSQRLMEVVDSTKMTVLTSLVQVRSTIRNATQNLDCYARTPGIADLHNRCIGRAGIVISAGPSLMRNVDELAKPGVRDRFVLVAVQTVIKPLLARGIRPHFITALDHSEISKRFYEGLTRKDVEGITLVVEPKVNPAVLEAWPGDVRTVSDGNLDRVLGDLSFEKGTLTAGATVAHLAYYLARHLGCDPVALIGQDLGFTDGQYYSPGAAIHDVWAGELNAFNTLEMHEWQRVLRMGTHLRRSTDVLGRPIFTDEQMLAYLSQFERDFKRDAASGLTTIDATEGGVRKQHTRVDTLREFIAAHWERGGNSPVQFAAVSLASPVRSQKLESRVHEVRTQVWRLGESCKKAETLLIDLIEHHDDQSRVNRLIGKLDELTTGVMAMEPAYRLAHTLSQTGAFNRYRSDRLIHLDDSLTPMTRQRRQAERDLSNVRTLGDTADELGSMLDSALATIRGQARVTRDLRPNTSVMAQSAAQAARARVAAVVPVIEALTPQGRLIPIRADHDRCQLVRTLDRLPGPDVLDHVLIPTDRPDAVNDAIAGVEHAGRVRVVPVEVTAMMRLRARQVWAARAAARCCWRGGLVNATAFDEVFDPALTMAQLNACEADAALLVGANWELVDTELCEKVIQRFREDPDGHRLTFTQAVPGLAPCVVGRSLLSQLDGASSAGIGASIGTLLGYNMLAPVNDLIASTRCVHVDPEVRDAGVRAIIDTPSRLALLRGTPADTRTSDALSALRTGQRWPDELRVRVTDADALSRMSAFASVEPAGLATLLGIDQADPQHAAVLLESARDLGLCRHVRTELTSDRTLDLLRTTRPEIVSVDLHADTSETYHTITGRSDFELVRSRVQTLLNELASTTNIHGTLMVVPRITRRDASYADIETFYHRWLSKAGWAVIDPLPEARDGERIAPLPLPKSVAARLSRGLDWEHTP